jgi:hypothetical protein
LIQAAQHQRKLTEEFLAPGNNWANRELTRQLIASAQKYGNLRYRTVEIPDWRYEKLGCFYSRALNGVFVFRNLPGGDFMVVEDGKLAKKNRATQIDIFPLTNKHLIDRLEEAGLITVNLSWYREHPEILEEKRDCLLIDILSAADPEIDYLHLTEPQKKARLRSLGTKIPKIYKDLERLIKRLEQNEVESFDELSDELKLLLLQPRPDLEEEIWELVGMLIARLQPWRLLITFICDKNLFYKRYDGWPKAKQLWAIATLKKHYRPKMNILRERASKEELTD